MCIGSNSVNQAQDLISVTKFEDFPNSLLPNVYLSLSHFHMVGFILNKYKSPFIISTFVHQIFIPRCTFPRA